MTRVLAMLLALLPLTGGCIQYVGKACPSCQVLNPRHPGKPEPKMPPLRRDAKRLFVIVPGALGYGWEWTPAVKRLAEHPEVQTIVYWWEPFGTIGRAARDLSRMLNDFTTPLEPRALEEVVIVAHSMAGIVAALAAADLQPPAGVRFTIATIGTPFAGMIGPDFLYPDVNDSIALFTSFSPRTKYPRPADGVDIIEYRTTAPEDPVMLSHGGHDPAPPHVGPEPRRRIELPHMDHNRCVDLVVERLLAETE